MAAIFYSRDAGLVVRPAPQLDKGRHAAAERFERVGVLAV